MSEEKMRAEFEAWCRQNNGIPARLDGTDQYIVEAIQAAWVAWQASTASKQREIDALNQQVLELSAQVEVMRNRVLGIVPYDSTQERLLKDAVSITSSSALLAHDNEVAAKALEEAAKEVEAEIMYPNARQASWKYSGLNDAANGLRRMAAERRNRK